MQMTTEKQYCKFVFEILKGPFSLRHNMLQLVQQSVDQSLHRVLPCHATDAYKMWKLMWESDQCTEKLSSSDCEAV